MVDAEVVPLEEDVMLAFPPVPSSWSLCDAKDDCALPVMIVGRRWADLRPQAVRDEW